MCLDRAQVLDESHTIAHTTKAARVVKQLIANRRWCMTGCVLNTFPTDSEACHDRDTIFFAKVNMSDRDL